METSLGLNFCTDRRPSGRRPNITQGGNDRICSRCTISSPPLVRRHRRKATGLGGIPISVWQAGGDSSSARKLLALLNTTRVLGRCAVGMRCGRVGELYKHEGDRNETKSHRGILVQDRPGAIHASFMKCDIDEQHMKFIHETQCWCAKGRGRCRAGQIIERAANFSRGRGRCWGRLCIDQSAAFESIYSEFLAANGTCDVRLVQSALKALNISASRSLKRQSPTET